MPEGKSINVEDLFANAEKLNQEKQDVYNKITANRELLRGLADAGMLSTAENKRLNELYPRIKRGQNKESGEQAS